MGLLRSWSAPVCFISYNSNSNCVSSVVNTDMFYPEIFLDFDGVFADYQDEYRRLTGGDPAEKGKMKAMRFKSFPHFYLNLPLLPDAMKLWNFVKVFHPKFLSAASNYLKSSREDKHKWVLQHFNVSGNDRVIIVNYPKDKWQHCKPGAILIDDKLQNCNEWEQAGGIAIHHVSADMTIKKLKQILQRENYAAAHHVMETFERLYVEPPTPNLMEAFVGIWQMVESGQDLSELYNEPVDSTVSDNGSEYDLNGLLSATLGMQVQEIPLSVLTWIFQWDDPNQEPERVESADINAPLLVTKENGKLVVLDGLHRLAKAKRENRPTVKVIFVSSDILQHYKLG